MQRAAAQEAASVLLTAQRHSANEALGLVPEAAGLYAIYGDVAAIDQLAVGNVDAPLYVGKAERSLVGRDLRTHFATSKTGSSTLRRTVAALLRERLHLQAVPRNLARPDGSANYALEAMGDVRLTDWMHRHLRLAVWVSPSGVVLNDVETHVLRELVPPLNLAKMGDRADARVKAARATMAAEARAWHPVAPS